MPVYQGVLKTISGGVGNTEGRWTVREFIDIGDTHLRNVYLTDYHDEVLKSAMGEEVAISIGGTRKLRQKKLVVAIRTPQHGVDRPTRRFLFGISAFLVLKHLILSPFVAAILLGVAAVAQFIADPLRDRRARPRDPRPRLVAGHPLGRGLQVVPGRGGALRPPTAVGAALVQRLTDASDGPASADLSMIRPSFVVLPMMRSRIEPWRS